MDSVEAIKKQLINNLDQIELNVNEEDIVYELILKFGYQLTVSVKKIEIEGYFVFSINDSEMLIYLENHITINIIREMANLKPKKVVCLDRCFKGNDQLKTNAHQTFKSYLGGDTKQQETIFSTI